MDDRKTLGEVLDDLASKVLTHFDAKRSKEDMHRAVTSTLRKVFDTKFRAMFHADAIAWAKEEISRIERQRKLLKATIAEVNAKHAVDTQDIPYPEKALKLAQRAVGKIQEAEDELAHLNTERLVHFCIRDGEYVRHE